MSNYLYHIVSTRVRYGDKGSCPIDQTPAHDFNVDPHTGRPMSDIQRLVHIQNDLQLASEFAQLQEFKPKYIDKELSDADALKYAVPRMCQLPSEILDFRVKQAKEMQDKQQAKAELERQKRIVAQQQELFERFVSKDSKPVVESKKD